MTKAQRWSGVVLAGSVATVAVVGLGVTGPVRVAVVFAFVALCPGIAFVRLLALEPLLELVLGVALSVALAVLGSETLVLARLWSPVGLLVGLAVLACIGASITARADAAASAGPP